MAALLYYLFGIALPLFLTILAYSLLINNLTGLPYVSSSKKSTLEILAKLDLKPGMIFIDLGSGDGVVVRTAVKKYGVSGVGIEINPFLVLWAKLLAKLQGLRNINFKRASFFSTNLSKASVIYLYVTPKFLGKLAAKIEQEAKSGTIVVCHGFEQITWKNRQIGEVAHKINKTYIYRI